MKKNITLRKIHSSKITEKQYSDTTNQNLYFQEDQFQPEQNHLLNNSLECRNNLQNLEDYEVSSDSQIQFLLNQSQQKVIAVAKKYKLSNKQQVLVKIKQHDQKPLLKKLKEQLLVKKVAINKKKKQKNQIKQSTEQSSAQMDKIQMKKNQKQYYPPTQKYIKFNEYLKKYLINYKVLPFIFKMSYFILERIQFTEIQNSPKIAREIFEYTVRKLIIRRTKEGGAIVNRMKYEEKIKFLIRAYLQKKKEIIGYQNREDHRDMKMLDRFNENQQKRFFSREEVKRNFIALTNKGIQSKRSDNQQKILQFESYIKKMLNDEYYQAKQFFKMGFTRKQLPWTSNMFTDIRLFRDRLYKKYVKDSNYATKNSISKQDFEQDSELIENNIVLVKSQHISKQN